MGVGIWSICHMPTHTSGEDRPIQVNGEESVSVCDATAIESHQSQDSTPLAMFGWLMQLYKCPTYLINSSPDPTF